MVIKSIKCKETARIFSMENSFKLPKDIHQRAYDKLRMLHNAASLIDLQIPPSLKVKENSIEKARDISIVKSKKILDLNIVLFQIFLSEAWTINLNNFGVMDNAI